MARIGANMPEGRLDVHYPDGMSLAELQKRFLVTLAAVEEAEGRAHNLPETGREKSDLKERDDV